MLRIPEWAAGASVLINGQAAPVAVTPGEFTPIDRQWSSGDEVSLRLPMEVSRLEGNARIEEVRNQVALKRGPVVYCVESPVLPAGTSILDVYLPFRSEWEAHYERDFLGGLTTLSGDVLLRKDARTGMYHALREPKWESVKVKFVPYYAWSNRGDSEMSVWIPLAWK